MNKTVLFVAVAATLSVVAYVEAAAGSGARTRTSSVPINGQAVAPGSVSTALVKADVIDAGVLNVEGQLRAAGTIVAAGDINSAGTVTSSAGSSALGIRCSTEGCRIGIGPDTYIAESGTTAQVTASGGLEAATGRIISRNANGGFSFGVAGSEFLGMPAGTANVNMTSGDLTMNTARFVQTPVAQSVASDGAGTAAAFTISAVQTLNLLVTCNDTDGCAGTFSETSAADGEKLCVTNVSANNVTLSDTSGVSELAGAATLGQWDNLCVQYITDRWVERSRSNN